jgi:hypothetical protein
MSESPPNNFRANVKPHFSNNIADNGMMETSGTQVAFSNGAYLTANFAIKFYANQIHAVNLMQNNLSPEPPERVDNDIKEFSKHSRRRLFSIITSLDYDAYGKPIFVSATWHEDYPNSKNDIKTHLDKFHKRLKRNLPDFHIVWKLEYQERGAPHFHFVLFPLDSSKSFQTDQTYDIIKLHWDSLKQCKCVHCKKYSIKTKPINEFGHCMIYISKEIGKLTQNQQHHNLGRIWGTSRDLRIRVYRSVEMTFKQYSAFLSEIIKANKLNQSLLDYIECVRAFGYSNKIFVPYEYCLQPLINFDRKAAIPKKKMRSITLSRHNFLKGLKDEQAALSPDLTDQRNQNFKRIE